MKSRMRRLPIVFLLGGIVLKTVLVLLWSLFKVPGLLRLLTTYDPGPLWLAEKTVAFLFPRGIAPAGATEVFELVAIVGFGIECLLVGCVISWFLRRQNRSERTESGATVTQ